MVRLKDRAAYRCVPVGKFQFHYGTIKRKSTNANIPNFPYFNSTMVRLKASIKAFNDIMDSYFNSTMVRLKVICVLS